LSRSAAVWALVDGLLEGLRSAPGVVSAGATTVMPLSAGRFGQAIFVEGQQTSDEPLVAPVWAMITPGFLETMKTPLVRGRYFDERDDQAAVPVAIVDERLANRFWPAGDALGKRFFVPGVDGNAAVVTERTRWLTIVGVVAEVRFSGGLAGDPSAVGAYYTPTAQQSHRVFTFAIESRAEPAAVVRTMRAELAALDPALVLSNIQTMDERVGEFLGRERLAMGLALAFGIVALFLSALGIYGVLAYLVAQRSHEIGVRMALGSTVAQVFGLVLREGLVLVLAGLLLGVAGIFVLGRALQGLAYGVTPTDPVLMALVALLLAGTALAASVLPARRATKVNPIVVLNAQ
jgi:predicted permease